MASPMASPMSDDVSPAEMARREQRNRVSNERKANVRRLAKRCEQDPARFLPVPRHLVCKTCRNDCLPCYIDIELFRDTPGWSCAACTRSCNLFSDGHDGKKDIGIWLNAEWARMGTPCPVLPWHFLRQSGTKRPRGDGASDHGTTCSSASTSPSPEAGSAASTHESEPPQKVAKSTALDTSPLGIAVVGVSSNIAQVLVKSSNHGLQAAQCLRDDPPMVAMTRREILSSVEPLNEPRVIDPVLAKLMATHLNAAQSRLDVLLQCERTKYEQAIESQRGVQDDLEATQHALQIACDSRDGYRERMDQLEADLVRERAESESARAEMKEMREMIRAFENHLACAKQTGAVPNMDHPDRAARKSIRAETEQAAVDTPRDLDELEKTQEEPVADPNKRLPSLVTHAGGKGNGGLKDREEMIKAQEETRSLTTQLDTVRQEMDEASRALEQSQKEQKDCRERLTAYEEAEGNRTTAYQEELLKSQEETKIVVATLQSVRLERNSAVRAQDQAAANADIAKKEWDDAQQRILAEQTVEKSRLEDIAFALNSQVKAAETAQQVAEKMAQEAELAEKVLVEELQGKQSEIDKLVLAATKTIDRTQLIEARNMLEDAKREAQTTTKALSVAQEEIGTLFVRLETTTTARDNFDRAAKVAQGACKDVTDKFEAKSSQLVSAQQEINTLHAKIEALETAQEDSAQRVKETEGVYLAYEKLKESSKAALDQFSEAQATIANLSADIKEATRENQSLEEAREIAQTAAEEAQQAMNATADKSRQLEADLIAHGQQIQAAQETMAAAQSGLRAADNRIVNLQRELAEAEIASRDAIADRATILDRATRAETERDEAVATANAQAVSVQDVNRAKQALEKDYGTMKEDFRDYRRNMTSARNGLNNQLAIQKMQTAKYQGRLRELKKARERGSESGGQSGVGVKSAVGTRHPGAVVGGDRKPRISGP